MIFERIENMGVECVCYNTNDIWYQIIGIVLLVLLVIFGGSILWAEIAIRRGK